MKGIEGVFSVTLPTVVVRIPEYFEANLNIPSRLIPLLCWKTHWCLSSFLFPVTNKSLHPGHLHQNLGLFSFYYQLLYIHCGLQQLETEKAAKVPGGIHDTEECNTPTDSVSVCLLKHARLFCVSLCFKKWKKQVYFYAILFHEAFYLTCEKWKSPRNLIWSQSEFEQSLWGVVSHQNVPPVTMWEKIPEKCGKETCFCGPLAPRHWGFPPSFSSGSKILSHVLSKCGQYY